MYIYIYIYMYRLLLNTRRLRTISLLWLAGGWSGANFDQVCRVCFCRDMHRQMKIDR